MITAVSISVDSMLEQESQLKQGLADRTAP